MNNRTLLGEPMVIDNVRQNVHVQVEPFLGLQKNAKQENSCDLETREMDEVCLGQLLIDGFGRKINAG